MIKKLQRKFITITALSLFMVMVVLIVGINVGNICQISKDSDMLLEMLSQNEGRFPDDKKNDKKIFKDKPLGTPFTPETRFRTRYFTAILDARNGEIEFIDATHIAAVTEHEIRQYVGEVVKKGNVKGYKGNYKYQSTIMSNGKQLIVFLDCQENIRTSKNFALVSVIIGVACMTLVIILVSLFSKRAIKPTVEAMEKQKQFITDAGHEIKTPLSIILANAEVLEMTGGENQWIESIRNQVNRLNELVKNLLELSRLDGVSQAAMEFGEVNLSEALEDAVDAFKAPMQTKGVTCVEEIERNVVVNADRKSISQLFVLLIDNAVKYARDNSEIEIKTVTNNKRVEISIYNACDNVPEGNLEKLFERFYRADESRSRKTGGYGIGLSVAKGIVTAHKGRITAERYKEGLRMVVVLPK